MRLMVFFMAAILLVLTMAPALAQEDAYRPVTDYDKKQEGVEYSKPETVTYFSTTCEKERKFNIYLPVGYTEEKTYPVLYLLHGIGGDHQEWVGGVPEIIIGNLIAAGEAREMIVVTPNIKVFHKDAVPAGMYSPETFAAFDRFIDELRNDVMPYLAANYSIAKGRENTAVAGLSMGGREALYIGLTLQDTFGYVGAFAPAPGVLPYQVEKGLFEPDAFKVQEGYDTFVLICAGLTDDVVGLWPKTYSDTLTKNGTQHIYYETQGAHNFFVWKNGLYNFVKNIFGD